mmetsp:Transcript_18499/g.56832  ORF Transcript_18499/g.56832 Transcript_18499/m.56832 type:complete len:234 (-) Transcript_18499:505-1206(-)
MLASARKFWGAAAVRAKPLLVSGGLPPPSKATIRPLSTLPTTTQDNMGSIDYYWKKDRIEKTVSNSAENRAYTYLIMGSNKFIYASAVRIIAIKFISTMSAAKDVLALAAAEFDVSALEAGQTLTVKWRGKPVFIRHRTEAEIAQAEAVSMDVLRDPQSDADRIQKSEWLVVMGICTHLGCVPIANAGDYGGWFCPCHGSHYDISGRIRKGPAPLNLEIPPYSFLEDTKIQVG